MVVQGEAMVELCRVGASERITFLLVGAEQYYGGIHIGYIHNTTIIGHKEFDK